jgi:hypothetical protein
VSCSVLNSSIEVASAGLEFASRLRKLVEDLKQFKPHVNALTIDYLTCQSRLDVLLEVPNGIRRRIRDIEIPSYGDLKVEKVLDLSLSPVKCQWQLKEGKWTTDAAKLPPSEKFLVTLTGTISKEELNQIVAVNCPQDPMRGDEIDKYWIHSAIKDVGLFERMYADLSVDRVASVVKVGVVRSFTTSIPPEVRRYLEARAKVEQILGSRDRETAFQAWRRFHVSSRQLRGMSFASILETVRLITGREVFIVFINVTPPYRLDDVLPIEPTSVFPESIGVRVQTDLNFRSPTADGELVFRKKDFNSKVTEEFGKLTYMKEHRR